MNVHVKVLLSLSPEKFNTFNTFNTFDVTPPSPVFDGPKTHEVGWPVGG